MNNPKDLIFKLLSENNGYAIYYAIPRHNLDIGNSKTMMFVVKDDEIVFIPKYVSSQFKMKKECDDYIEKNNS